jgi:hypothetical protein
VVKLPKICPLSVFGQLAHAVRAVVAQRETDRRLVVLVERRTGAAQVAAGDRRDAPQDVIDRAARRRARIGGTAGARHQHQVGRQVVVVGLRRRFLRRERTLFHQLQFEQAGRPDDVLGTVHVVEPRQFDADVVAVLALAGDARLGDPQFVDAALDRLLRLHHRFFTQLPLDVRLHREGVRAGRAGRPVEVGVDAGAGQRLAERRVLRRGHAFDAELVLAGGRHGAQRHTGIACRFRHPLHLEFRLDAQGGVGFDAQHQVDTTLQVQSQLELFVHHRLRRRQVIHRRDDRVHPDHREEDQYGETQKDLPAQVLVHVFDSTGGCP